jgi:hypothetical protein
MKPPGTDNNLSQPARRAPLLAGGVAIGVVACVATTGLHAQDTPPSVYFPTSQEENVVNPEMRHWSPPRNLWPEQPGEVIAPDLQEDPQERVDTKYTSDPNVKVKTGETRGQYTDPEERYMQWDDANNDRPSDLWPQVEDDTETVGANATQTLEYSEKVKYNTVGGAASGGYADPVAVTPNRGEVEPTTYYVTKEDEKLFQIDTVGETSEALWAEELWSTDRVGSVYDSAAVFFTPLDEVFRAASWGPTYNGNRARERYWNPQVYNSTHYWQTNSQINQYYRGVDNHNFGRFDRMSGLNAEFGDTFGDRNRFTYEGQVGLGNVGLAPLSFRNYVADPLLRVGPLYLVDLSLSYSLLYTDYDGPLADNIDDQGFISILTLNTTALLQLTENFYLSASGFMYWLPFEGDVGFGLGNGLGAGFNGGNPISFARLAYEFELFSWDWMIYDELALGGVNAGIGGFWGISGGRSDGGGIDRVGRYSFGEDARSVSEAGDESSVDFAFRADDLVFSNSVGIMGTGLFLADWRGTVALNRSNYWNLEGDDDNESDRAWNSFRARADYVNPISRWHPYAEYTTGSDDDFDDMDHTVMAGVYVDVTQNISVDASLGYYWNTGDTSELDSDSFLWELGIYHRISQYLGHTLRGGQVYARDTYVDERYLSQYIRYGLNWNFGPHSQFSMFAQYADIQEDDNNEENSDRATFTAGARLDQDLGDYTDAYATIYYFTSDYDETYRDTTDGWSGEVGISTQFLPRWYLSAFYRYTDQNSILPQDDFTEHLVLATITRRF